MPQCFVNICRAHGEAFTGKESASDNNVYIHNTLKTTGLLIEVDDMDEFLLKPQLVLAIAMLVELSKVPGNRGVGRLHQLCEVSTQGMLLSLHILFACNPAVQCGVCML